MKAFQDHYPENVSQCYGCGSLNAHGHRIRTFWDGDETVTRFTPEPFHTAVPGFVYGGLVARSSTATAPARRPRRCTATRGAAWTRSPRSASSPARCR